VSIAGLALLAAAPGPRPPSALPAQGADLAPVFVDATEAAGIRWGIHELSTGGWNLVETMGGGGGFVDYDGDGWLDVYLVSYSERPQGGRPVGDALYRNNRDGTFTDVTQKAGIGGARRGMGLAVADYDGDGWSDLYVSGFNASVLYRNRGDGTFEDATERAFLRARFWGCSATFLDYDRDGRADLFVSSYLEFDPQRVEAYPCQMIDDHPFCTISKFQGQPSRLYRNLGSGRFEDVSASAGVAEVPGKGMGVVAADLDDDGLVDVFQTNDSAPNFLFKNLGGGRFRDVALEAGVAVDSAGRATGAMATDAEDVDGDGRLDLLVTNFNHQGTLLHRNEGGMSFVERGAALGLSLPTFKVSSFGARFLDHDNDGDADLLIAAGHPFAPVSKVWPEVRHADPPFLFDNDAGRFRDKAPERGEALRRPHVGRGVAVADYDNDGDPDALLLSVGEPPVLLRNDGGNRRRWLGVRLVGTRSGPDAIGARVSVTAGARTLVRARIGGASYLTASDPRLLFGLGASERVSSVEVRWPSGRVDRHGSVATGRYVTITEGSSQVR
jgi:hypothetical protein